MNRKYTAADYKRAVNTLRRFMPDVSLTTDVIVGFPGESKEEFQETYEFLKDIKLNKMHIFKYSKRTGTKAATMPFQVDGNLKEERSKQLLDLSSILEKEFMEKFVGRDMMVLYEESHGEKENHYVGYTENYIKVVTESCEDLSGKIVKTYLTSVEEENMIGKLM